MPLLQRGNICQGVGADIVYFAVLPAHEVKYRNKKQKWGIDNQNPYYLESLNSATTLLKKCRDFKLPVSLSFQTPGVRHQLFAS